MAALPSELYDPQQNAQEAVQGDADARRAWLDSSAHRESLRLHRAICLAPTIHICEALLRGQHVPAHMLDQTWLRRFR